MKECDAPELNNIIAEVSLMKSVPMTTSGASRASSTHCDVIDLSVNIVLSSSNKNRISPTGRRRGGHNYLRKVVAWIGALVGKVTFLPISVAPPFAL
jgi:hypothetical protein